MEPYLKRFQALLDHPKFRPADWLTSADGTSGIQVSLLMSLSKQHTPLLRLKAGAASRLPGKVRTAEWLTSAGNASDGLQVGLYESPFRNKGPLLLPACRLLFDSRSHEGFWVSPAPCHPTVLEPVVHPRTSCGG